MSLNEAVLYGNLELVRTLLQQGADVNLSDEDGGLPLNNAAWYGHLDIVNLLIQNGANVNLADEGWTPLQMASENGHVDIVRVLLENGANVDAHVDIEEINTGNTSLTRASKKGYLHIVYLLIDYGANVNHSNTYGWTPLMFAAWNGHTDVVKKLLHHGAIINLTNRDGGTALDYALLIHADEMIRLLIKYGASYRLRDVARYYPEFQELYRISLTFNFSRTFDGDNDEKYEERAREENKKLGLHSYTFLLVDSLIRELRLRLPNKGEEGYVLNMAQNFPAFLRYLKSQMDVLNTNPPRF